VLVKGEPFGDAKSNAELFETIKQNISLHLSNVVKDNELTANTDGKQKPKRVTYV